MQNTCRNCKWSYLSITAKKGFELNLRCHPDGDKTKDQKAGIPCLKWQLDDSGEI